ncbi:MULTISPECIES: GIY-YIG nuclease family protein [Burkholderia]|uniref:GIY-YIG nuclease family protein n=1 Tax=Burkholderia TaxID=32008 RepID=UPI00064F9E2D|nr:MULTISPECIES: GIY-YIG nuclease family protein [Burkholderia]KML07911.1 hypothetical protein VL00_26930 [Burkholderia cepacia]KMN62520.1 hypothetical protein VK92_01975 [Burkholderia sp. LK4]
MVKGEEYIVYLILDENEVALYVGVTKRKHERLTREHFTPSGHVDQECYRDASFILYAECASKDDAMAREKYLIKTLHPRFNEKHNKPGIFSFEISFDWKYMPIDKSRLNTQRPPRKRQAQAGGDLRTLSFEAAKRSLGVQLSFDCSPAVIEGPGTGLIWLDGERLHGIVDAAWAELGSPGALWGGPVAHFVCKILSRQDWVGHTEYSSGLEDDEMWARSPSLYTWGDLAGRVPWLLVQGNEEVRNVFAACVRPWQVEARLRSLIGTLATSFGVSERLFNWRDRYILDLIYLREVLETGARIGERYVVLTNNLERNLMHDWFCHQSGAAGYKNFVSGVSVEPNQSHPMTIRGAGGKRDELETRWYREVFPVGRRAADQLNRTVWVYPLAAIDELQHVLDIELRRLQDGATDVLYHGEPFTFENYYDTCPTARAESPKPLLLE